MARPTIYSPKMIELAEEYIQESVPENMKITTVNGLAIKLGVNKDTLYEWAKKYPEFSVTFEKILPLQQEQLIHTGIFGGKEINATIVALLLKSNHGMVDRTATDVTSQGEKIGFDVKITTDAK